MEVHNEYNVFKISIGENSLPIKMRYLAEESKSFNEFYYNILSVLGNEKLIDVLKVLMAHQVCSFEEFYEIVNIGRSKE